VRDLDSVRSFLSSLGPTALFDLPWLPLYILVVFAFHSMLGVTALCGATLLVLFTLATELLTRKPAKLATDFGAARHKLAEASRRNAEVLMAMGLQRRLAGHWRNAHQDYAAAQQRANDVGGGLGAVARVLRMMLQSTVLGVGAYLVIQQETSAGVIIAAAILVARALAPVDLAIAHWRNFISARQSWARLKKLLMLLPAPSAPMPLPAPVSGLSVENVIVVPPGQQKIVVQQLGFTLSSGQGMGIVGPSGSGKSSLARAIVGAWLPARGKVCLDGASLDQWSPDLLGRHIGYLPQDVELLAGSVAQNIARFDPNLDPEAIIKAARAADVHDLVVSLPNGYETPVGESGAALSAGQRQRIGLARALYGDPFLVVLDEPDANLDVDGGYALAKAILSVRTRGGIVIVVAHRHSTLAHLDFLLALQHGQMLAVGPKDAVMKKARMVAPVQEPLKVVPA
jgi:ATP-binding cassette subfamily C protein